MKTLFYILVVLALLITSTHGFSYDSYYGKPTLNERIYERNARQQRAYQSQRLNFHLMEESSRAPQYPSSNNRYGGDNIGGLAGRPKSWERR